MNRFVSIFSAVGDAPSGISEAVRQVLEPALMITMAVLGVLAIVVVLLQKSTSNNVGAISGETETYMGKNKGSSFESKLKIATVVLIGLLLVVSVVYFVIQLV